MEATPQSPVAHAAVLVQSALADIDNPAVPLSAVIRKALRIARLRNDAEALIWLDMEVRTGGDEEAKMRIFREVAPHFEWAKLETVWRAGVEAFIADRKVDDKEILGMSVPETEVNVDGLEGMIASTILPSGFHTLDAYDENQRQEKMRAELRIQVQQRLTVLARIRQRVADFLSTTERELLYGQVNADIFERNREFVDAQLKTLAPQALEQFAAAHRRRYEGDPEARSHALTSGRRVLKTVADLLYPATNADAQGIDGSTRTTIDDRFVSRLCQFATEHAADSKSGELLVAEIEALGKRLDAINDLSSKGVDAAAADYEVDQWIIQTYLAVGDLLRLRAGDSRAGLRRSQ